MIIGQERWLTHASHRTRTTLGTQEAHSNLRHTRPRGHCACREHRERGWGEGTTVEYGQCLSPLSISSPFTNTNTNTSSHRSNPGTSAHAFLQTAPSRSLILPQSSLKRRWTRCSRMCRHRRRCLPSLSARSGGVKSSWARFVCFGWCRLTWRTDDDDGIFTCRLWRIGMRRGVLVLRRRCIVCWVGVVHGLKRMYFRELLVLLLLLFLHIRSWIIAVFINNGTPQEKVVFFGDLVWECCVKPLQSFFTFYFNH